MLSGRLAISQQPDAFAELGTRIKPETPEFQEATEKLREHVKKMRAVLVHYNVGDAQQDRKWKEQWLELQAEGAQVHRRMIDAALAEYKLNLPGKADIGSMLFRLLKNNIEDDRFDGMLPIAQALVDSHYDSPDLMRFLAMSAFATGEFEIAKPYMEQLIEQGEISPEFAAVIATFEQVQADWQEELRRREEDAQGEPLPRVLIKTTKGDIEVELFENQAPETVGNFIYLIEQGFYNNLTFHRVIKHFMAQAGCPQGDGLGGPGYMIHSEAHKPNARKFFRGSLAMALAQNPDTGGSQFFLTFLPTPQLDAEFTVFGRVVSGFDVLSNLNRIDPENKDKDAAPVIPDEIREIEILFKRDHEYLPNKVAQ